MPDGTINIVKIKDSFTRNFILIKKSDIEIRKYLYQFISFISWYNNFWIEWEMKTSKLYEAPEYITEEDKFTCQFVRIETHYFVNRGFLKVKIYSWWCCQNWKFSYNNCSRKIWCGLSYEKCLGYP